jgi:hypothetical protein
MAYGALCGEPVLEQDRGFAAFHAPAGRTRNMAEEIAVHSTKRKPIRNVQIKWQSLRLEIRLRGANKSLLKDQEEHFFPKQRFRVVFRQSWGDGVAGVQRDEKAFLWRIAQPVSILSSTTAKVSPTNSFHAGAAKGS